MVRIKNRRVARQPDLSRVARGSETALRGKNKGEGVAPEFFAPI
jgi:hypothetical protein